MPIRTVSGAATVSVADPAAARQRVWETLPPGVRQNPSVRKKFGLGDAVELAARPFKRVLGIQDCPDCDRRRDLLNAKLPSLNPFRIGKP
jgi:hypothetical protein